MAFYKEEIAEYQGTQWNFRRGPYYSRGAILIIIMDMDKGYWQVELYSESKNTHVWNLIFEDCSGKDFQCIQWLFLISSDNFQKKFEF